MHTIEVDFEVYKKLTVSRATEDVSYNDVIRALLGLGQDKAKTTTAVMVASTKDWVAKGVRFPVGTDFRANYKGQMHAARVESGSLMVNGKHFNSPSAAAVSITGNPVNGWRFWECKFPGKSSWQLIEGLRR